MKLFHKIALVVLAAGALSSCCKKGQVTHSPKIGFSFAVKGYSSSQGSGQGDAFADGDRLRVFEVSPLALTSAGTVKDTSIALDRPLEWTPFQTEPAVFAAVYSGGEEPGESLNISCDLLEGGKHDYARHDRLFTSALAVPALSDAVKFEFTHPFSRILLNLTESLPSDALDRVEISGLQTRGVLDVAAGSVSLEGGTPAFEPHEISAGTYAAVVLPQKARTTVSVFMKGGAVYRFKTDELSSFEGAYSYSADLNITPEDIPDNAEPVGFSFSVSPWTDGDPLNLELDEDKTHK